MQWSFAHKPVIVLTLFSLLASVLSAPAARAQTAPPAVPAVLQVSAAAEGAVINYDVGQSSLSAADAAQQLPSRRYNGYQLPIQFFTLQVTAAGEPRIDLQGVVAGQLTEPLQPALPETPPALGWEPDPGYTPPAPELPTEPVFIARQGLIRGQRIVVVAVSPIFAAGGAPQIASSIRAVVAGATPLDATALSPAAIAADGASVVVPVNRSALTDGYKIIVSKPGLYEVLYSDLGITDNAANLRLTFGLDELPIEKAGDRLRFYAPQAGDRWNRTSTYWLTLTSGTSMSQWRNDAPAGAALGAYEQGTWSDNKLYKEAYPGADKDHWFHADLEAPALSTPSAALSQTVPVTVPVQTVLPLRAGVSDFDIVATSRVFAIQPCLNNTDPGYLMQVQVLANGNLVDTQMANWKPFKYPCQRIEDKETTSTATASTTAAATSLLLRLVPNGVYKTGALLEAVTWRRPVDLDFTNMGAAVEFYSDGGAGTLNLRNLPAAWRLYDITNPKAPQTIAIGSGSTYAINQPASAPASRYLLADVSKVARPAMQRHTAIQFGNVKSAGAIYIGPAAFADELAPLLALREQQGFTPIFVDVQKIYDVFGFGQVSAVAIRNFLRQESDWQNPNRKISVVLAGDATVDPFAYGGTANEIVVAAWMDEVDPHQAGASSRFGEAACDTCIAQLNGDDPLTGDNQGGRPQLVRRRCLVGPPARAQRDGTGWRRRQAGGLRNQDGRQ